MIKTIRLYIFFVIHFFSLLLYASDSLSQCNKNTFVIAIDIGHTKDQPGASSSRGISEFYFNQNIGQRLFEELVLYGFKKTFIINEKGNSISLTNRTDIANKRQADLFLSIHHDSVQPLYLSPWIHKGKQFLYSDEFSGYSLFYSQKNQAPKNSLEFARLLGSELRSNLFIPTLHHAENVKGENRKLVDKEKGIYEFNDLVVLKTAKMPAVLIECGIIVNRDEEILLSNPVYQKAIVLSIGNAVKNFCQKK